MIWDKELLFIDKGMLTAFSSGAVGDPLDLGARKQMAEGLQSWIAVSCLDDVTATGDPAITLALEFSDDDVFAAPVVVPLSLPPLAKEDMAEGALIFAPAPLYSKRFVRLTLDSTIDLACSRMTAGIVLGAQTNR
jgi:hypothetical protein